MATKTATKKAVAKKQAATTSNGKPGTPKKVADSKPPEPGTAPPNEAAAKQPDDSKDLVVFAFRLTRAERDLIHAAAGSAKASRFVRGLALAAAQGDVKAIQQTIAGMQPATG
jgi:hypothetical protein